jgi:hypothetical protein
VAFRHELQGKYPDWNNAPVRSFGAFDAGLLVVGPRARHEGRQPHRPAVHRRLCRRPSLRDPDRLRLRPGLYRADPTDGLRLVDCRIANAVRCLPPENKPLPVEFTACRPFLQAEIAVNAEGQGVAGAGQGRARPDPARPDGAAAGAYPFIHGRLHKLPTGLHLADSYHCSRYNTNTGRLTTAMFHDVFRTIRTVLA